MLQFAQRHPFNKWPSLGFELKETKCKVHACNHHASLPPEKKCPVAQNPNSWILFPASSVMF